MAQGLGPERFFPHPGQQVASGLQEDNMKHHRLTLISASLVVGAAGALIAAAPALAAPPPNGCPAGYQLLSVQTLTAEGYHAPALVDSPTSGVLSYGKPANGDGYVCGVKRGNQLTPFGLPVYEFADNTLPASS
jgi:hypothetical protein